MEIEPQLSFAQDGKDLVISLALTANNSPHAAWTQVVEQAGDFALLYQVIQNRDLFVRSRKEVTVTWRIANHRRGAESYHVERSFTPTTEELNSLLTELQELVQLGSRRGPRKT